ncbi:4-hydroxybenzoate octaprenyltransferase [Chlamydia psittaci]|uniref:4-hydroxybenzoate octaprenyltransferase n=1 Tax=Chlamydia psittaci TaxID=83554 RepID=UPI002875692F|nr:4-hydroxybenzoate octaprenyltransferase [Chlamydia psittaci]MDS0920094.1 putative 4-hydroxybenzoate polyprenyltransferase [Chlamydia psittaci]MDS0989998.1 putative 4-hydroxybenzoate polyprenyltransferase [Chlamydia psittaci]MDS0995972.1 putative 4-hydroxybenzoate polyprenyltransferase [Chlamydia psittaci]MDS1001785.1 putative 4-hydroxybenzoate polyprenyltransferase [Chlamydia psittaci]
MFSFQIKYFQQLLNIKYAVFSAVFLAATTVFALTFPEIASGFSEKGFSTVLIGGCAFLCARTVGILVNQIIDRDIDKKNPRTTSRVLPAKKLSIHFVFLTTVLASLFFLVPCTFLSKECSWLALFAILLMIIYAYAKRFTYFCHWILGLIYYLAILMNFYALSPKPLSLKMFIIASLWGITAAMIIAANDIIYAIQDFEFDRREKLYSIPSCFGKAKAIRIASVCLLLSLLSYIAMAVLASFSKLGLILSLLPVLVIGKTIKIYYALDKNHVNLERCFFRGNIYLALSFFIVMVSLLIS